MTGDSSALRRAPAAAVSDSVFGPFRIARVRQAVYEGDRELRLGSRAFEVLLALADSGGALVTKDALLARVWPQMFVDDSTLRAHITALRKALGDAPNGSPYIVNVPGRGYRLAVPVAARPVASPVDEGAGFPVALSRMVGRDEIVRDLAGRLPRRGFLTIVGPGGMGKTSVAMALADRLAPSYAQGARFVDLAPLTDPLLVPSVVASAFGLQVLSGDARADLAGLLRTAATLIVLDNCEHVVAAAAGLAETIRQHAPGVHILATSREPLRAGGEWVYRLPSLALPSPAAMLSAAEALRYPAIRLFNDRAAASLDSFVLTDQDAPVVAEICRRLDGIPLAIELVAARVDVFGVRGLATRLDDRFSPLFKGRRTAAPRHRTLGATLDWSYQSLPVCEQALLRRLSVFRGSFTLDAATRIAECPTCDLAALLDAFANLAAKSLLAVDGGQGTPQYYRLLETTRAYAGQKLVERGEAAFMARRHASHVQAVLVQAEPGQEVAARDIFAGLVNDLRAALDWAFAPEGDTTIAVALTAASVPLWFALALLAEYCDRAERALAVPLDAPDAVMKLNVSLSAAIFNTQGGTPRMAAAARAGLRLAEQRGDAVYQVRALWFLARERYVQGDNPAMFEHCERAGAVLETAVDPTARLGRDRLMAQAWHLVGDQTSARQHAQRAHDHPAAAHRTGHRGLNGYDSQVVNDSALARILWVQGFADQAVTMARRTVEQALRLEFLPTICHVLAFTACPIALWIGDTAEAARYTALLLEKSANASFGHWQSWRRCYELVAGLGTDDGSAALRDRVLALQLGAPGPVHADLLATLRPDLAAPLAIMRAEAEPRSWCAAEVLRAKGVMLLRQGGPEDAAAALFQRAFDLAQSQGARSWALRAATSLAMLRPGPGRAPLARALQGFTEGFDTADFRQAARLLAT